VDQLLKFDPVEVVVIALGFIGTWVTLRNDSKWHTAWIKKHSTECDEQRKANNEILTELRTSNAHLCTLTESHHERLVRMETRIDAKL